MPVTLWHEAHLRFNRVTDDLTSGMPHLRKFARPVDWGWLSNDAWPRLAGHHLFGLFGTCRETNKKKTENLETVVATILQMGP